MTTNTWPNPDKPGAPLNPERSADHVLCDDEGMVFVDTWMHIPAEWLRSGPPYHAAKFNEYVGFYYTPAEVAALVADARREEREACAEWHESQANMLRDPTIYSLPAMPGPIICKDRAGVHEYSARAIRALGDA